MFEHAVGLTANVVRPICSPSLDVLLTRILTQPEGDLEFASRSFAGLRHAKYDKKKTIDTLLPAFFVLDRYCARRPDDATALHLFALVCERLGHSTAGAALVTRAIAILEAAYEDTEDPAVERRFTVASITLARLQLTLRDYAGAGASFESALGLLAEDESAASLRAQAHAGAGLAHFMAGELEGALAGFEAALESAGGDVVLHGQVTVLLAQTMWAIGTEEFKETAKAQLLEWYVWLFLCWWRWFGLRWMGAVLQQTRRT